MSNIPGLEEWQQTVGKHLPHLSKPQAAVLAMFSFGIVMARSCALTAVASYLAELLHQKQDTQRQRLREFCYDAADKQGDQRQSLAVEPCFAPLLGWVLSLWEGRQLALAIDATTLGDRFTVLAASVVYRGCAIPVAWAVLPGNKKQAWRREWLRLLRQLGGIVPGEMTVIVLADRGLYARWLYRRIVRLGWHPFLRINTRCYFRPTGAPAFAPLQTFVPRVGTRWSGSGTAYKTVGSQLDCTLLAYWGEAYKDAWFILTDLPAEKADICWYALRAWIEHGFKLTKRGGWQWHRTRMHDPARASRLWLAVAVATLWVVSVGGVAAEALPGDVLPNLTEALANGKRQRRATRARLVSVFRRGLHRIITALLRQEPLPMGRLVPEPWPAISLPVTGQPQPG